MLRTGALAHQLYIGFVVHAGGQQQVFAIGCFAGHTDQGQIVKGHAVGQREAVARHIGREFHQALEGLDIAHQLLAGVFFMLIADAAAEKNRRVQIARYQLQVQIDKGA